MIFDPSVNTCLIPSYASLRILAYYSHLIPLFIMSLLAVLVFIKAKQNLFSKVFLFFVGMFYIWLIGDLITWTSGNYYLIYAVWSTLVLIEIIFYTLGFYFAVTFVKQRDMVTWQKIILLAATITPFIITVTGKSVTGFDYPTCLAFNNNFLDIYKLVFEGLVLSIILIYAINPFFRKLSWKEIAPKLVVLGSMFLFLSVFGVTEYLGSATSDYRMNLYSLFLLPVFLVSIIYSVFELDIFNVKTLGSHYLVIGLVILMGGQLFFITNNTNRLITVLAILMAGILSVVLFRNVKRESDQRTQIAKLNIDLQNIIKQRESLVHLVTHKVKGSFTKTKYIFAGMLDGTFGDVSPDVKKYAQQGLDSDNTGIQTVDLVLNAANLQKGTVKYDLKPLDFKAMVMQTIADKKVGAEAKGLKVETDIAEGPENNYNILGDAFWLKEVVNNLVENSIKYTKAGNIKISLHDGGGKIKLAVKDSGVGITDEDKARLFTEGGRGKDSVKINVDSTGYGLYTVKLVVEAHKGKVWAESEGQDKGSTFFVELPALAPAS